jgi:flagellar biosynthesis protein FlhB
LKNIFRILAAFVPVTIVFLAFTIPTVAGPVFWIVIIVGVAPPILLAVIHHHRQYLIGHRNAWKCVRNAGMDVFVILLTIFISIWLAGIVFSIIYPIVFAAFESLQSGIGNIIATIFGLSASLLVGFCIGFPMRWTWGRLIKKLE